MRILYCYKDCYWHIYSYDTDSDWSWLFCNSKF